MQNLSFLASYAVCFFSKRIGTLDFPIKRFPFYEKKKFVEFWNSQKITLQMGQKHAKIKNNCFKTRVNKTSFCIHELKIPPAYKRLHVENLRLTIEVFFVGNVRIKCLVLSVLASLELLAFCTLTSFVEREKSHMLTL